MATLDYVIVSEYARIDPSGLVTIVGGSFDRVQAPQPGAGQQLFITLRALLEESETSISFEVKVRPPTDQFAIGITGHAARRPDALPIDGRVGVVATVGVLVPLLMAGRHEVHASLDDSQTRILPFMAVQPSPPARVNCMRIRYSRHARDRMVERGVSDDDLQQCLNQHVQRTQTARQNQYKGDVGGRMLKVSCPGPRHRRGKVHRQRGLGGRQWRQLNRLSRWRSTKTRAQRMCG